MTDQPPPKPTLAETGQVYVSLAAAREYAAHERLRDEEARRELTELAMDARETAEPGVWRMRRRSSGLDLQLRVAKEGRLLVVTHARVREGNVGGRRG